MRNNAWIALALFIGAYCSPAAAHQPSNSYLSVQFDGNTVSGYAAFAVRDLHAALGVDDNGDGSVTWGEVKKAEPRYEQYLREHFSVGPSGAPCPLTFTGPAVDQRPEGTFVFVLMQGACRVEGGQNVHLTYTALFDIDPLHRSIIQISQGAKRQLLIANSSHRELDFSLTEIPRFAQLLKFLEEGVWHIWIGYDHILFLLSLLLPAVLVREGGQWRAAPSFRAVLRQVLYVVTAFTVAHSITLSLAVLDIVSLPSRLVESVIALSVAAAALNNVFRLLPPHDGWKLAFLFGLVHGFGFASALEELGLPKGLLAGCLFSFNVGVELGQLAIVAVFVPLSFWLRRTDFYRRAALTGGSVAITAVALYWFWLRVTGAT